MGALGAARGSAPARSTSSGGVRRPASWKSWDAVRFEPVGGRRQGPTSARLAGAADLDGDGAEEFVLQRFDEGQLEVWGLTPNGLEREAVLPVSPSAILVDVVDLDADGSAELLWFAPSGSSRSLVAWELDGLAGVRGGFEVASGFDADWAYADAADYDGDGVTDLLLRYRDSFLVAGLASGRLQTFRWIPTSPGDERRQVVGSLELDGRPGAEIALQDRTTQEISVVLTGYPDFAARLSILHPGAGWRVVDLQAF